MTMENPPPHHYFPVITFGSSFRSERTKHVTCIISQRVVQKLTISQPHLSKSRFLSLPQSDPHNTLFPFILYSISQLYLNQ